MQERGPNLWTKPFWLCDWNQNTEHSTKFWEKERREEKSLKVNEQLAGLPRQTVSFQKQCFFGIGLQIHTERPGSRANLWISDQRMTILLGKVSSNFFWYFGNWESRTLWTLFLGDRARVSWGNFLQNLMAPWDTFSLILCFDETSLKMKRATIIFFLIFFFLNPKIKISFVALKLSHFCLKFRHIWLIRSEMSNLIETCTQLLPYPTPKTEAVCITPNPSQHEAIRPHTFRSKGYGSLRHLPHWLKSETESEDETSNNYHFRHILSLKHKDKKFICGAENVSFLFETPET